MEIYNQYYWIDTSYTEDFDRTKYPELRDRNKELKETVAAGIGLLMKLIIGIIFIGICGLVILILIIRAVRRRK